MGQRGLFINDQVVSSRQCCICKFISSVWCHILVQVGDNHERSYKDQEYDENAKCKRQNICLCPVVM